MRFSERFGYRPVREIIQIESVNEELRNAVWSVLSLHAWYGFSDYGSSYMFNGRRPLSHNQSAEDLSKRLWFKYFKKPLDTIPDYWGDVYATLRKYFFGCAWYEVYDFVEFIAENYVRSDCEAFIEACNYVFETEFSAYRFVNGVISPVTAKEEVDEIELAVQGPRNPVRTHLQRALELLSDRHNPDYRNSIKESISAIESLVAIILGEKGTLGQLVKKLEDEIDGIRTKASSVVRHTD